ncbi:unnamed protein product [Caenorhabditis angaria]|uniref:C6 domain-containing protein n=1 Tax=Caenorhabditis angaria TaxID=860376 RepID=A0A9P1N3X2_9PELO|nr:unnamed protein product [Caenorhabditis angaria]
MSGVLYIAIYFLLFKVSLTCIPTQQVVTTTTVATTTIPDACASCGTIYCTGSGNTIVICEDETLIGLTYTNSADGLVCTATATCSSTASAWYTLTGLTPEDTYIPGGSISVTCTGSVGVWYNGASSITDAYCALF